jgi:uncharacterized low-complexity protein
MYLHPTRNSNMSKRTAATLMCLISAMLISSLATASDNPFSHSQLTGSHQQLAMEEGKCGEAKPVTEEKSKCGAKQASEVMSKCGSKQKAEANDTTGTQEATHKTSRKGKCGSAKCGASKRKH